MVGKAGVPVAGDAASGVACASAPLMVGTSVSRLHSVGAGDMPVRAGTFDAVGDGNPAPAPSVELPGVRLEDVGRERSPFTQKTHE